MKRVIVSGIMVIAVAIATTAQAGWFSKAPKVKKLEPAHGYTEEVELVTNSWDEAVELSEREPVLKSTEVYTVTFSSGNLTICTNAMYSSTVSVGGAMYGAHGITFPEPEPCTAEHVSDYPKSRTTVDGVQKKITTTYYRDGKAVARSVKYTKPHFKVTRKVTTSLEKKTRLETTTENLK